MAPLALVTCIFNDNPHQPTGRVRVPRAGEWALSTGPTFPGTLTGLETKAGDPDGYQLGLPNVRNTRTSLKVITILSNAMSRVAYKSREIAGNRAKS